MQFRLSAEWDKLVCKSARRISYSQPTDELKAKLLSQAEAAIERLLSDKRLREYMTLSDIEGDMGASEIDFRQRVLDEIVHLQHEQTVCCSECGG